MTPTRTKRRNVDFVFNYHARAKPPPLRVKPDPTQIVGEYTYNKMRLDPRRLAGDCTAPKVRTVGYRPVTELTSFLTTREDVLHKRNGRMAVHHIAPASEWWHNGRYWPNPAHPVYAVETNTYYDGPTKLLDFFVRCRTCPECVAYRRRMWTARVYKEFDAANRTWFVTLTAGFHARLAMDLSDDPDKWLKRETQLFMKRLRRELGKRSPVRFIAALEHHKDGTPHMHLLVHDQHGFLRYRAIKRAWSHGFVHAKLALRDTHPHYILKYITKQMAGRVQCSLRYGS